MSPFDLNVPPINVGESDDGLVIDLNQDLGWDDSHQGAGPEAAAGERGDGDAVGANGQGEGNGAGGHGKRDDAGGTKQPEDAERSEKHCPGTNQVKKRRNYTNKQRRAIYTMLLERTTLGILRHGTTKSLSLETGVAQRVIQHIWLNGKRGGGIHAVDSKKPRNCGRKRVAFDVDKIKDVPLSRRKNLHDLAAELGVSRTTLHRRLKELNLGKEWWSSVSCHVRQKL